MTEHGSTRQTFSKGSIAVNDGGVTIVYKDRDWVTQSIQKEGREILLALIQQCEKLFVRIRKGSSIQFSFLSGGEGTASRYYAPMEKEMTREEWQQLMEDMKPSEEFLEFFSGVDTHNKDEVFGKMREWTDIVLEKMKKKVYSLDTFKRWPPLKEKALQLSGKYGCNAEVYDPNDISDGSITLQFPEVFTRSILFTGENKDLLGDVVNLSSLVDFEMNPAEGYLNVVFYP